MITVYIKSLTYYQVRSRLVWTYLW